MPEQTDTPTSASATPQQALTPQQSGLPQGLPPDLVRMLEVVPQEPFPAPLVIGGWPWPVYPWDNYDQALWEMHLAVSVVSSQVANLDSIDNGVRLMAKACWLVLRKGAPGMTALDRLNRTYTLSDQQALNLLVGHAQQAHEGNIVAAAEEIVSACGNCPVSFRGRFQLQAEEEGVDPVNPPSRRSRRRRKNAAGGNAKSLGRTGPVS